MISLPSIDLFMNYSTLHPGEGNGRWLVEFTVYMDVTSVSLSLLPWGTELHTALSRGEITIYYFLELKVAETNTKALLPSTMKLCLIVSYIRINTTAVNSELHVRQLGQKPWLLLTLALVASSAMRAREIHWGSWILITKVTNIHRANQTSFTCINNVSV